MTDDACIIHKHAGMNDLHVHSTASSECACRYIFHGRLFDQLVLLCVSVVRITLTHVVSYEHRSVLTNSV